MKGSSDKMLRHKARLAAGALMRLGYTAWSEVVAALADRNEELCDEVAEMASWGEGDGDDNEDEV